VKGKIILGIALALSVGLFINPNFTRADGTNAPASTNATPEYATVKLKSGWDAGKITLHRTRGGPIQLDAKVEVVTEWTGPYTNDVGIVAFVDPETRNAWAGPNFGTLPAFYLEDEAGILRGTVWFGAVALGAGYPGQHDVINGVMAFGQVNWDRSLVPTVKHGETVDAVIAQLDQHHDLKSLAWGTNRAHTTIIQNSLHHIENGLTPWFFVDQRRGSDIDVTSVTGIAASGGILRLDLKGPLLRPVDGKQLAWIPGVGPFDLQGPAGSHTASVWIDLKTWKVVRAMQDGRP